MVEAFHVYLLLFIVGAGYAIISALLAGVFGGETGADAGGAVGRDFSALADRHSDTGHGRGERATSRGDEVRHGAAGAGRERPVRRFSPLNPLTVSVFMALSGGVGIVFARAYPLRSWLHVSLAAISGFAGATAVFYFFRRMYRATHVPHEPTGVRLVGLPAIVIVPITGGAEGEVQYVTRGTLYNAPARSEDGRPIGRGTSVVITDAREAVFRVRPWPDQTAGANAHGGGVSD